MPLDTIIERKRIKIGQMSLKISIQNSLFFTAFTYFLTFFTHLVF